VQLECTPREPIWTSIFKWPLGHVRLIHSGQTPARSRCNLGSNQHDTIHIQTHSQPYQNYLLTFVAATSSLYSQSPFPNPFKTVSCRCWTCPGSGHTPSRIRHKLDGNCLSDPLHKLTTTCPHCIHSNFYDFMTFLYSLLIHGSFCLLYRQITHANAHFYFPY
jgi:hypothetical protein